MNHDIQHLRNVQMDTHLAFQLANIISAYRPHTTPLIHKEDKVVKEESTMDEIQRLMKNQDYYRSEYIKRENQKAYEILSEMYYD